MQPEFVEIYCPIYRQSKVVCGVRVKSPGTRQSKTVWRQVFFPLTAKVNMEYPQTPAARLKSNTVKYSLDVLNRLALDRVKSSEKNRES